MTSTRRPRRSDCSKRGRCVRRPFAEACGEPEGAALAGLALDPDRAAHQLGQAAWRSPGRVRCRHICGWWSVGLLEGLEQRARSAPASCRCRCRCTGKCRRVGSRRCPPAPRTWTATSPVSVNLTALLQKLIRIWPEPQRIAAEVGRRPGARRRRSAPGPWPRPFRDIRLPTFSSTLSRSKSMFSIDELAGLDLGEIEDVVDDAEQVLAGAA